MASAVASIVATAVDHLCGLPLGGHAASAHVFPMLCSTLKSTERVGLVVAVSAVLTLVQKMAGVHGEVKQPGQYCDMVAPR